MLIFQVIYSYLLTVLKNGFDNLGIIPVKNRYIYFPKIL